MKNKERNHSEKATGSFLYQSFYFKIKFQLENERSAEMRITIHFYTQKIIYKTNCIF